MKDDKNQEQYPGYPHYPAGEDITRTGNNTGRQRMEADGTPKQLDATDSREGASEATDRLTGTDADVTAEDLRILDSAGENMDTPDSINLIRSELDDTDNDGDPLNEPTGNMSGGELDVPGSSADDADEAIGEEDEENNYYSLGGDNHEGQEEYKGE